MQPRLLRASDYRQQAARLHQQAVKITDPRKRIELLDLASHYETLAATAEPLDHRGTHPLRRRVLVFD